MSDEFQSQKDRRVAALGQNAALQKLSYGWIDATAPFGYVYNFSWLGLPIIQLPQDVLAIQEILWRTRPEVVVETGIARGGSLVLHASILELLGGAREVIGIDREIRPDNRRALEAHPLFRRMRLLEGDSSDPATFAQARQLVANRPALVVLDSNHTHEHVLKELRLYSALVPAGGYLIVFDTVIEHMAPGSFPDRPWDRGDNPWTAVQEFLAGHPEFEPDPEFNAKLLLSSAPGGYLRRVPA